MPINGLGHFGKSHPLIAWLLERAGAGYFALGRKSHPLNEWLLELAQPAQEPLAGKGHTLNAWLLAPH